MFTSLVGSTAVPPLLSYSQNRVMTVSDMKFHALKATVKHFRKLQSMELSRPEYWSGYPFPSPGGLPNPGIKPRSPALQVDSLTAELLEKPISELKVQIFSLHL